MSTAMLAELIPTLEFALAPFQIGGAIGIGKLELGNPWALLALLLPLVLLLLAKSRVRPVQRATGSLHLWMRLQAAHEQPSTASRAHIPPALWFFALALCCACLAASEPRIEVTPTARVWRVVVDRSPSMFLPRLPQVNYSDLKVLGTQNRIDRKLCPKSDPQAALRLEVSLDRALVVLSEYWRADDRVVFSSPGRESLELNEPSAPPRDWLAPDPWPSPRPNFEASDARGYLLVTDRKLSTQLASLFASGGAAVPGLIGRRGSERWIWRGAEACEVEPSPPRTVVCVSQANGVVIEILKFWCAARGFRLVRGLPADAETAPALVLNLVPPSSDSEELLVARDGWSLQVSVPPARFSSPSEGNGCESWLRTSGRDLVRICPGQIFVGWSAREATEQNLLSGDPASFALSWSRLFDQVVLPEVGAVSIGERQSAGDESTATALQAKAPDQVPKRRLLGHLLAMLAALLAFIGTWLSSPRQSGSKTVRS